MDAWDTARSVLACITLQARARTVADQSRYAVRHPDDVALGRNLAVKFMVT
jgi:hypothetical protein